MHIISGTIGNITSDIILKLGQYRHKVFVDTLGWPLQVESNLEFDQFDRSDTLYLIAFNQDRQIIGTGRLLPCNKPYLLADVFPELMEGCAIPRGADVWELSRFSSMDFSGDRLPQAAAQFHSPASPLLLQAALDLAAQAGVSRLITVSPLGIERILRRLGFSASRAAPPRRVNGELLFACWIDVPQAKKTPNIYTSVPAAIDLRVRDGGQRAVL